MFCPQCNAEYRPGFTQCSDCDVALVERLDPAPDAENRQDDQLRVVFTASDIFEANLIKSMLEANGIEVYTANESPSTWFPGVATIAPVDGIEVAVPSNQEDSALDVLDSYPGEDEQDEANTEAALTAEKSAISTLPEIETAVDALPLSDQEELLRRLTERLRPR